MIGLFVLIAIALWASISFIAGRWLSHRIQNGWRRTAVSIFMFIFVFFLPVADELIAWPRFIYLCKEANTVNINEELIKGKRVQLLIDPLNKPAAGTTIPILHSHFSFRDVETGVELAQYDSFIATGGFMARLTGFPSSSQPWTGTFSCSPPGRGLLPEKYKFTLIN